MSQDIPDRNSPDDPFAEGSVHKITIDRLCHGGYGLGRIDEFVVFVPFSAPGDQLRIAIVKRRRTYAIGEIVEIVVSSQVRREFSCPHFKTCGGCHLGHIIDDYQTVRKNELLGEELGCTPRPFVTLSPTGYRNKATFHIQGGRIGYYRRGSQELVEVDNCLILDNGINELIPVLKRLIGLSELPFDRVIIQIGKPANQTFITFITMKNDKPGDAFETEVADLALGGLTVFINQADKPYRNGRRIFGPEQILLEIELNGTTIEITNETFFQVNYPVAELLFGAVAETLADGREARLLELYAGMGAISISLAGSVRSIYAVEISRPSCLLGTYNCQRLDISNISFRTGKALTIVKKLRKEGYKAEIILLDPPRGGCDKGLIDELVHFGAKRIIYVSCALATLKRDLGMLATHGYTLRSVQGFNMFPQTYHFEILAVIEKPRL